LLGGVHVHTHVLAEFLQHPKHCRQFLVRKHADLKIKMRAPFGSPTRCLVSFRIRTILSCSSKLPALAGVQVALLFANSGTEIASVLLLVRI
jgi:hypothetical protein